MKLGSLRQGGRDGTLVVVSSDLAGFRRVPEIAATLQAALDDWAEISPRLAAVAAELAGGGGPSEPFDPDAMAAPLPRAYQWADGSAYVNHVELLRKAGGAAVPASFSTDALVYQGGSDSFLGPTEPIAVETEDWGIDFEAEIACITDDVPLGCSAEAAKGHIRLLTIANDVSLRALIPAEMSKGFGFFQSKPSTAFAALAVTPDELGPAWDGQRLHLPLLSFLNDGPFGRPDAGVDMTFDFPTLIAHATKTRRLGAGTIIGSGTVSNRQGSGPGTAIGEGGVGYSCIAEARTIETIIHGKPKTPFLRFGDHVRIEMLDAGGRSVFGAIDQRVEKRVVMG
jgi:fumarylacetoacetate (FAA) hydrolase